jgi:predicted AlkP superfamily pyrophosphatase or phosphodiesterase
MGHPLAAAPTQAKQTPKLVVVFIADQCAWHYIPKLRPFFKYGLKELLDNGIVYANAYHPHGTPETTPGHNSISTGTLPKDHGAILNQWITADYRKIAYDNGYVEGNGVYSGPKSQSPTSKSCDKTMVDGLSDQFVLNSHPNAVNKVIAVSLKSYPAIATAQREGKAIWLDEKSGNFVSNQRYFTTTPTWLTKFNRAYAPATLKQVKWSTCYDQGSKAYQFTDAKNYAHAAYNFSMIERGIMPIDHDAKTPYELFIKTPTASKILLDLAKTSVDATLTNDGDRLILWVCLSNLDLLTHFYGPDSMEAMDTIYHLDRQIKGFMDYAKRKVGERNCLFVFTADHGIGPIPELVNKRGLNIAHRIMAKPLMKAMNDLIYKKYWERDIIKNFEPTYFVWDEQKLSAMRAEKREAIINELKRFLKAQPGIKTVWTFNELKNSTFLPEQLENFYKNQLYEGRSGDLIVMPQPYCQITNYPTGTSHSSPYDYDTHVPLVLYQKGSLEHKWIRNKVWMPQLAGTIAQILNVSRPSASIFTTLPGVAR